MKLARATKPFFLLLLSAGVSVVACNDQAAQRGGGGATDKKPKSGNSTGIDDGMEELDEADDTSTEGSLDQVLKECGVDNSDLEDGNKVLLEKTLRGWPKVNKGTKFGFFNYEVVIYPTVTIRATSTESTTTTDFVVKASPALAQGPAEEEVNKRKGTSKQVFLSVSDRQDLMSNEKDWKDIVCTVQPVREIVNGRGSQARTIRFTPALPASVSPKATASRYKTEIGDGREFRNIQAEVVSSSDPALPTGTKVKGTVIIRPTTPKLTLEDPKGGASTTVRANIAYEIVMDFGDPALLKAMGLDEKQTMLIDTSKHEIKAVAVDSSDPEEGRTVLLDAP